MTGLTFDATLRVGSFEVSACIEAESGCLVVVGPNGAGKTTLIRALAGLERIESGRVVMDGSTLDDGLAHFVPPHAREIGFVAQHDDLFPFADALGNVAFGLRQRGASRSDARRRAVESLERLRVADVAHRRPSELSGGQRKRVAIARALAIEPRLCLFDEPLAALDATTRSEVRRELRKMLTETSGVQIVVSHDTVDALSLGDRIVVMENGRITQDATPERISIAPQSRYAADFVGVNLFEGTITDDGIRIGPHATIVATDLPLRGTSVIAVIHPNAVVIHTEPPEGSARNVWKGSIVEVDELGDRSRLRIESDLTLVAEVTPQSVRALELVPGRTVYATVKATEVAVHHR